MTSRRLAAGGAVDRNQPLKFTFAGRSYLGLAGDTLASALLANGLRVLGRSFKYHRPRGLMAAGVEESNVLVRLESGSRSEVNLRATEISLYEGLSAWPVNCWPNVRFDIGALNGLIARFIPAGFYYKTLMWPDWHLFEGFIRRAAGLGRPSVEPDPDRYDSVYAHCDVLIVGAGPTGLAAALAASRTGARVIVCEQDSTFGGTLLSESCEIDAESGNTWLKRVIAELSTQPETLLKLRTTAVGYFDHNALVLVERYSPRPTPLPRQRLWQVRAKRVILATGALERPLVFPGNDRPGIMLASAVKQYLMRFAVSAGERMVIFTNNDSAYDTARLHLKEGGRVPAIIDIRDEPTPAAVALARELAIPMYAGAAIVATFGRAGVRRVKVRQSNGRNIDIRADAVAMSGGFNPTVHLFSQSGGRLQWVESLALFKPGESVQQEQSVGAGMGIFDLRAALVHAYDAGTAAAAIAGYRSPTDGSPPRAGPRPFEVAAVQAKWLIRGRGKAFVDFQNDVTSDDIALAARENYTSVEHLKRYTTLGMAPDQGKTSNVNGLGILGEMTGRTPLQTGTTRYRFPFTPISMGVMAGRVRSALYRPVRRLACHADHVAAGAVMDDYGGWQRPAHYLRTGENGSMAEVREASAVRNAVGLFDGSPLGKFIVKGAQAAGFLDRIYANTMSTLKVGRLRYGMMLNESGIIIDDGVTARLGENEFLLGTSSGAAVRIGNWLEEWLQCEWLGDEVLISPETHAWSVLTVSGPRARAALIAASADGALTAQDFSHMSFREGAIAGIPVRVMRVSFTGETSFEINVSAASAPQLWARILAAGAHQEIMPVGIDAWDCLRMEKGYLHVGSDTDGTTTPPDVGWENVLKREVDFIGSRSLTRPDNLRSDRFQFVGFESCRGGELPVGSHVRRGVEKPTGDGYLSDGHVSDGYVTSAGFSHSLSRWIALGMLRAGRSRMGSIVAILTPAGVVDARIVAPCVYDPQGLRLNA